MQAIPILDLKAQLQSYRTQALEAMTKVVDSQMFILGAQVKSFEEDLAKFTSVTSSVGVSSGTDALLVALMALDLKAGDEVIVPAMSFFATAGVVSRLGATPVFVDIDPQTFNTTEALVRAAITDRTKAIIPVHLFGQACDLGSLYQQDRTQRPVIIEDAAQSLGAQLNGVDTGRLGDVCCTSFFPSKNLGGFGDGGAVYGNDEELLEKMRILRVHGSKPKYHHHWVGGNFRLDALQAAVLQVKLPFLNQWAQARRDHAHIYIQHFSDHVLSHQGLLTTPYMSAGATHVFNQFVIRTPHRDALKSYLADHNIGTMIYYPSPLHTQPCFADLGYKIGDFPHAEQACKEVLALPVYPELSVEQIHYIIQTIENFFTENQLLHKP